MISIFKKISLIFVLLVGASTQAAFAFKAAGFVMRHRAQVMSAGSHFKNFAQQGIQKARPVVTRIAQDPRVTQAAFAARTWIIQDPKRAAGVGMGAYLGYRASGEGFLDTTVGTGLGALAGLSVFTHQARAALAKSYALAIERNVALQASLAGARAELTAAGVAQSVAHQARQRALGLARNARKQLWQARESLSQLKNAAPVITKPSVVAHATETQSMSFWELFKAGRSVAKTPSLQSNTLVPIVV